MRKHTYHIETIIIIDETKTFPKTFSTHPKQQVILVKQVVIVIVLIIDVYCATTTRSGDRQGECVNTPSTQNFNF